MILALGISIQSSSVTSAPVVVAKAYEFDNNYWQVLDLKWDMTKDTWEEEL